MTISDQSRAARSRRLSAALVVAILAGSTVSGCDDRSPAEKALVQSSRETHTVSGGSGPGDAGFETKKRQAAATALTSVEGSTPAEVAAMMSTLAQTQLGQSTGAKAELVNVEREAMLKESLVRGLLGEWASRASLASSLESFDATDAINDLGASTVTKQRDAIDFGARKKELDAKIADLKAKADAANAQGAAAEAEYAKLRDQAQSLSAVQAEPLVAQAATFKRKSDEAHIQAARYLAEADVMSPESAEAAQSVERTANQIKGLEEARKHLQDRMAQSKSDGRAARAEADQVAENLDKAVQDYKAYRSGAVDTAYAALAKAYSTAAGTAKKATEDKGGGSKLALGAAQQALGDLHWNRAKAEQKFALLMDRLANVTPELAKKSAYADDAKAAMEAKKTALESAKSAFEGAVSAYRAAGAKGQVKEQIDAVIKRLEAFAAAAGDDKLDVLEVLANAAKPAEDAAPAEAAPNEAPASPETATIGGESRPLSEAPEALRQSVEKLASVARDGDMTGLRGLLQIPDELAATMDQLFKVMEAQSELDRACREKFQKGLADAMGGAGAMMSGMGGAMGASGELDVANATFTMPSEDTAVVSVPATPQALTWKSSEGGWKLQVDLGELPPAARDALVRMAEPLAAAFREVAEEIKADKLQSIQAVGVSLMQKLGPIIQQMQQGGGGGGGGGG
ncbi:MAG: hypothetical protein IT434_03135 [Phycisphaerales bacterium]|nr:hypothetical protein [Phycisphaerales bacterium]